MTITAERVTASGDLSFANYTISAEELTYRYGDRLAVDHISFDVAAGEILGFLGPNGAGKSTTLKMLTGQLRPLEGRALLLGKDVAAHTKEVQAAGRTRLSRCGSGRC